MNLYDAVNEALDSFIGKQCTYQCGTDTIEKVRISAAAYGATDWTATLKYAGDVDMFVVELIDEEQMETDEAESYEALKCFAGISPVSEFDNILSNFKGEKS